VAADVAVIDSRASFAPSALFHLWRYRELLISLTQREVKARYRQSLLGFGWAVVQPLALMVVFNLVFSRFAKVGSEGLPYPIFSYAAMVPWTFLSNALNSTTIGLVSQRSIVTKCYFPREIIIMSQVGARFVDFLAGFAVYGLLMAGFGIGLTPWALLLPLLMLLQTVLVLAISLITSALHVRFRDLAPVVGLGLQIWLYLTPVGYPIELVPEQWAQLYALNPMVGIVDGYRAVLAHGWAPNYSLLASSTAVTVLLLAISYAYFKRAELTFADVI
jgi:homopolymeric O-antigen transport system permease protein